MVMPSFSASVLVPKYRLHLCLPLNKWMRTRAWENWSLCGSPGMSCWVRPLGPRMTLKVDVIFKFQWSFKSLDWMWWRHRPCVPLTGMLIQTEVCAFRDCRRLWWACSLASERSDGAHPAISPERKRRSQRLWVSHLGHWGLCQGGLEVTSPSCLYTAPSDSPAPIIPSSQQLHVYLNRRTMQSARTQGRWTHLS